MTTLFKSSDGRTYAVLEMGHCQKHGDYPAVMAAVSPEDTIGFPSRRFSCPFCAREAKEKEAYGSVSIPKRFWGKTLDNFEITEQNRSVVEFFRDYAEHISDRIEAGTCIVLTGRPGTGKTHLACALLTVAIGEGRTGFFTSVATLFRAVRETWRGGSQVTESEMIARFVDIDLLVIDEVGVQAKSDNERNILFSVINGRYEEMKPTIILSNETLKEVKEIIGERAFDRLREGGGRAFSLQWDSYRSKASKAEVASAKPLFSFYERELHSEESVEKPILAQVNYFSMVRNTQEKVA